MKYALYSLFLSIAVFFYGLRTAAQTGTTNADNVKQHTSFRPGETWYDDKGVPINAHGGGILFFEGVYYWYGEIKKGKSWLVPNSNWENYRVVAGGVSCYSSKNLLNWKYEGVALPATSKDTSSDLYEGKVIERPKVIYNAKTKQFVMWLHLDAANYSAAKSGVAVGNSPQGPFVFLHSERPNGNMARDMTIFQDDDGRAYHFYSSEENATMHIALLADDYLSHTTRDIRILVDRSREAPAVFKYKNKYYLITSGCTGWAPNSASYAVADSILGEWKEYSNPCKGTDAEKTFFSQSTCVLPLDSKNGKFIFMADRWNKSNLEDSRYIWLPLSMDKEGTPGIKWQDEWKEFTVLPAKHQFSLGDSTFLLDGQPFQVISGEMHYPRVPREAWRQRMKMAKAMGLNTIGTYVFWNLHEPEKGKFDFSGNNDIAAFVKTAQEEGLWVILRPSPYVCAEWEFGGYPYWLQNEEGLVVRSREEKYLKEYKDYIIAVGRELAPLQINHGGNILMVQIENEYGSYGKDKEYLDINRKLFIEAGFDGLLYTCDPASDVANGRLEGLLPAVNGLDKPGQVKKLIRNYNGGKGPFFIAEWYPAWFDWWGTQHHTVPADKYAPALDSVLAAGVSVNMYMFHGGTTRAFMNGANFKYVTPYEPQISSYDYDAPLDEAGNATAKFMRFRNVIQRNLPKGQTLPDVPAAKPVITIPDIKLTRTTGIFDMLSKPVTNSRPLTFEELGQAYGYVIYQTELQGGTSGQLKLIDLRDYALVFINKIFVGKLDRRLKQDALQVNLPKGKVILDIMVENMGRINFGPYLLKNKKGITEKVTFNNEELKGWKMFSLPFNNIAALPFKTKSSTGNTPVVKKGNFNLGTVGDTYLDLSNWGKGCVWINGHNLGRYWNIGPQQTIYVPAEWLKKGNNEIVILELIKPQQTSLRCLDKPILNRLEANAGQ